MFQMFHVKHSLTWRDNLTTQRDPASHSETEIAQTTRPERAICDYEGSNYQAEFWGGQDRDYEDQVERIALRRLLPPQGATLIDVGAGFGRLADLYAGYQRVVLADYSRSMLRQAQDRLGKNNPRFVFVAANVYQLPFVDAVMDTAVMVRVAHHLTDVPAALAELARIIRPSGCFIFEFANKRNVKSILRYLLHRQNWNPFDPAPVEFVRLNYNFHPHWIERNVDAVNLEVRSRLSVSHFRLPLFKKVVPLRVLIGMDSAIQQTGKWWLLSPSGFLQLHKPGPSQPQPERLFRCPSCTGTDLRPADGCLACTSCGKLWRVDDGLYDFKEPV